MSEGPGTNNDGCGVSTMLETAQEMAELRVQPRTKVRLIFFSREEQCLPGSAQYVPQLSTRQVPQSLADETTPFDGRSDYSGPPRSGCWWHLPRRGRDRAAVPVLNTSLGSPVTTCQHLASPASNHPHCTCASNNAAVLNGAG
ncbi:M28 family peptidase [Nakamurella sp. GG22]